MSIISIGSAFRRPSASDSYHSGTFKDDFRRNLDVIRDRVESPIPRCTVSAGILAGKTFDPGKRHNQQALTGCHDPCLPRRLHRKERSELRSRLLSQPVLHDAELAYHLHRTYQDSLVQRNFRSVNLNHAYRSTYNVGSYNTFQSFMSYMGDIGCRRCAIRKSYPFIALRHQHGIH